MPTEPLMNQMEEQPSIKTMMIFGLVLNKNISYGTQIQTYRLASQETKLRKDNFTALLEA